MRIQFLFNFQSESRDVLDAIEVAKKLNGKIEESIYQVEFSSVQDKNLMKLYLLVGHHDESKLTIDGEEFQPEVIYCVFNCPRKSSCSGKCIYTDENQKLAAMKFCEKFDSFRANGEFDFYVQI